MATAGRKTVCVGLLLALFGCRSEAAPFTLEIQFDADPSWGDAVAFAVDGDAPVSRSWVNTYPSHRAALDELTADPLPIACVTGDQQPCGSARVDTVCEWAIDSLAPSPIVLGYLHVGFDEAGVATVVDRGNCVAADGNSTHGFVMLDANLPDAHIYDAHMTD